MVLRDRLGHCMEGALLAAAALRVHGHPPLVVYLASVRDDDHVVAVYRRAGLWGAVAKSNYSGLRSREPVYRSLRELAMSYFEHFYNLDRCKTLRGYTRPFNIARHDRLDYAWDEAGATRLYQRFYAKKDIPLIPPESERLLNPADKREYDSAFMGVNWDWVYRPQK